MPKNALTAQQKKALQAWELSNVKTLPYKKSCSPLKEKLMNDYLSTFNCHHGAKHFRLFNISKSYFSAGFVVKYNHLDSIPSALVPEEEGTKDKYFLVYCHQNIVEYIPLDYS